MKEEQLPSPGVSLLPAPANRSSWVALDLGHVLPFGSQLHRPYVRSSHVIGLRRLFVNLSRVFRRLDPHVFGKLNLERFGSGGHPCNRLPGNAVDMLEVTLGEEAG